MKQLPFLRRLSLLAHNFYWLGQTALILWKDRMNLRRWILGLRELPNILQRLPLTSFILGRSFLTRRRLFYEAEEQLSYIDVKDISEHLETELWSLKASCANALGHFEDAYRHYQTMNALAQNVWLCAI